jgi:hypothetical protein
LTPLIRQQNELLGSVLAGVADERTPLKQKSPQAAEVFPLIERFPLLKNLLE